MICLALCFLFTGCSYGMDWFEALLMERSSFSINVSYNAGNLKITWSENPPEINDGFAGYEVYMIPERWNEFGTYEVIAARYDLHPAHFFSLKSELGIRTTRSVTIYVPSSSLEGEGEYYVRLGIITMDSKDKDTYYDAGIPDEYKNHSSLLKISGYKAVYIH